MDNKERVAGNPALQKKTFRIILFIFLILINIAVLLMVVLYHHLLNVALYVFLIFVEAGGIIYIVIFFLESRNPKHPAIRRLFLCQYVVSILGSAIAMILYFILGDIKNTSTIFLVAICISGLGSSIILFRTLRGGSARRQKGTDDGDILSDGSLEITEKTELTK